MPTKFLLISHTEDTTWPGVLNQALSPLGSVEVVSEKDAIERITQYQCGATVVIIDAVIVEDVPGLIFRLRRQCPKSRIIVATASPTWQRARAAFQAGAVDYIRRSWNSKELLNTIKKILSDLTSYEDRTPSEV